MQDLNGKRGARHWGHERHRQGDRVALGTAGATVAVSGRDKVKGRAVVEAIRTDGGSAIFVAADLIDAEVALDLAACAVDSLGGEINTLVNNAGTSSFGPTASHDEATFDISYALNVKAPYFLVAALAPAWLSGGQVPSPRCPRWWPSSASTAWPSTARARPHWNYSPKPGRPSSARRGSG